MTTHNSMFRIDELSDGWHIFDRRSGHYLPFTFGCELDAETRAWAFYAA